jgi:two-component system, OmpR family, sensor histidine kinase KdpD
MPDRPPGKGRLRILLGYAAGVGKTYKMLEEAQQSKREGRDVVVGYFEPHGRADTIAKLEGLEVIPRLPVEYRGHTFEEMDSDAILARHPEICAVDEFPHSNIPGMRRAKRWEDVLVLLDAGIDVVTTMNVQHLESLNDQIREITGVHVRETIPDWVVKQADEVVLVDIPPGALLNRMQRGVIYGPEKAQRAMENFFKGPSLNALREIALRQIAHEVDLRQNEPAATDAQERILIHITESPATDALIRRGKRVADYLKAECFAVAVLPAAAASNTAQLQRHLEFARKLRVETRTLESDRPAEALVDFARRNGVTQIFLAKPPKRSFWQIGKRPLVMEIVRLAQDRQVTVVAERRH